MGSDGGLSETLDKIKSSTGTPVDLVIILAGTNDLAYENDCNVIFRSICAIHDIAHCRGIRTIAVSVPPSAWQQSDENASKVANDVNVKLESWCQDEDRVTFAPFPIRQYERSSGLWCGDGLHFSPEGYTLIGQSLASSVVDTLSS